MKKYILLLTIACCLASCKKSFLDPAPTDRLAETAVWTSPSLIEAALNYNYNDLCYGIYSQASIYDDNQMLANLTDEVASDYEGYEGRNVFMNGELNSDNVRWSRFNRLGWNECYNYISRSNEFIDRLQTVTVLSPEQKDAFEGEIKTLRAWRYFNLLKEFGGVPLISKPFKLGEDFSNVTRASIQQTVDFILADLDQAIAKLPEEAAVKGRIDKLVAKAFRSRVLLYAASPLYTDGVNDIAKWTAAATAAKEVIDAGRYSLEMDFEKYRNSFIRYDPANPEMIFVRESDVLTGNGTYGGLLPPLSHGPMGAGGVSYFAPIQQLVDDFEMINGLPVTDPTSGYDPQNPYVGRDLRFNAFIYHQGSVLNGRVLDYRLDGPDRPTGGIYVNPTGYNMRKFIYEARFNSTGTGILNGYANDPVPWINIRFAEILLNYAEAINEVSGPAEAYGPINQIRERAGLPDLPAGLSQADMRERIWHERRIELVFEEHRFYDVRRWKVMEQTQSITIKGISVTGDSPDNVTYEVVPAEGYDLIVDRTFLPKHYFWPIAKEELRAAPGLTQTPGY